MHKGIRATRNEEFTEASLGAVISSKMRPMATR
jgi:hypothetical protein